MSQDIAGTFKSIQEAEAYSQGKAPNTSPKYHKDRVRCLSNLMKKIMVKPIRVLDFGCGDGLYSEEIGLLECEFTGIDLSESMISLASERFSKNNKFVGIVGGVEALSELNGTYDLILAIDVIAYLKDEDEEEFYRQSYNLLRKGGSLIVMTGNELFDMFALNSGTVDFFRENFNQDISSLLVESGSPRFKNTKRKNPLSFGDIVSKYGFETRDIAFSQYHRIVPAKSNRDSDFDLEKARLAMRDHDFDPNNRSDRDFWKSYFECSIFGMRFERV